MRIVFVLDAMIYGGIERIAINYLNILIKNGFKVDVIILNPNVESIINEIPKECNIRYVKFSKFLTPHFYWAQVEKYPWGKFIFPIIYFFLNIGVQFMGKMTKLVKIKYDIAISFSGHFNDLTYTINFVHATDKICWLHGSLSSYILMSKEYGVLYNKIKNIVVLSEDMQEETLSYNPWIKCEIDKIYNPIVLKNKKISNDKVETLQNKYGEFLLMVGRLSKQKDHQTVIDAIYVLKNKYNLEIPILFVGDGPEKMDLEAYAIQKDVSDLIVFVGNQSEVQDYYKSAKLFIHSSPMEGLPTVLLEAMYFELPIVATDSKPGVREILGDDEYGRICPVRNPEAMAQTIYRLLNDKKQYEDYKNKGLTRIEDFSEEKIFGKLSSVIDRLEVMK